MKKALVTGGARPNGIGFATAKLLAANGFDVVVTGATEQEVRGAAAHPGISARLLDVRDTAAVNALVGELEGLAAVVNCAGVTSETGFDIETFANTVDINLTGTMRVCMAAYESLKKTRGCIVNIGSVYSTFGSTLVPDYAASKGGVIQLTKSLATAWGKDGIRVNAVAPGFIRTAISEALSSDPVGSQWISSRTPLGRLGDPDDLAGPIAFLCSDSARFVTGVTIPVDGGYIVNCALNPSSL